MKDLRKTLLAADIARARARRHKACPSHGRTKVVCNGCARVYCPRCMPECPTCERPFKKGAPKLNGTKRQAPAVLSWNAEAPEIAPIWPAMKAIGAVRVDTHADSGGYLAVFPFPMTGVDRAADISQRFFTAVPSAQKTSFGAGRMVRPDHWYVTFTLADTDG